eukprot:m.5171 g.5171  ORF g.5171 m.5171 type:complete len:280 (+) comp4470_c0_seq2:1611-2450(+)
MESLPQAETLWLAACGLFALGAYLVLRSKSCLCRVNRHPTEKDVGREAALLVADVLQRKPTARILFLTGSTPIRSGFFATLKELKESNAVDFSKMRVVGGDEYAGVTPNEPGSFALYLQNHVVRPLGAPESQVLFLDGSTTDVDAECQRYESSLRAPGGKLDLCILGLGLNGHVAFNDPPSDGASLTRVVKLTPESIATSKGDLTLRNTTQLPTHALSIGIATIIECSEAVCVLVTGASKQKILKQVLQGPVVPTVPASYLRTHRHVQFMTDEAAAALL